MSENKKVVIKVDMHDSNCKRKALMAVTSLSGISSILTDKENTKLTIIGDINPVNVMEKLKKWNPIMLTFGPEKEEKKKEEKKPEIDVEVLKRFLELYGPYFRPYYGP